MTAAKPPRLLALLAARDFRLFIANRVIGTLCYRTLLVAVGWQIYDMTSDPLALGFVGLSTFVPTIFLLLPAGEIADRFDRRLVLLTSLSLLAACTALLTALSIADVRDPLPFYGALALFGAANSLYRPSSMASLASLAPRGELMTALLLHSTVVRFGIIAGPLLGGGLYVFGPATVYAFITILYAGGIASVAALRTSLKTERSGKDEQANWLHRLGAGLNFARRNPLILGSISLELFVTLLGGATILLPVFARDILNVGPLGLGVLRAAPAVGAIAMTLLFARISVRRHSGLLMFAAIAVDGVATALFGLSETFLLSLAALVVVGAMEMVSINFRQTVVQLGTPDHMRGRVNSVQQFFVGGSSELGDFESGAMAAWLGAAPAVIVGGGAMWVMAGLWMWMFPELRRVDRVNDIRPA